jgi:hypothetical protein
VWLILQAILDFSGLITITGNTWGKAACRILIKLVKLFKDSLLALILPIVSHYLDLIYEVTKWWHKVKSFLFFFKIYYSWIPRRDTPWRKTASFPHRKTASSTGGRRNDGESVAHSLHGISLGSNRQYSREISASQVLDSWSNFRKLSATGIVSSWAWGDLGQGK